MTTLTLHADNDLADAIRFRRLTRSFGSPINDIWIAAFAIENGLALATNDGHFSKVPMLRVI